MIFNLNILKLVFKTFLGRIRMINPNTFEKMEISRGRFGAWILEEFHKIYQVL